MKEQIPATPANREPVTSLSDEDVALIVEGRQADPHRVLGRHDGRIRAYRPGADALWLRVGGDRRPIGRVLPAVLVVGAICDGAEGDRR